MNTLRITFIAGLLSISSAYAQDAGNWTAAIGTGRVSASSQVTTASAGNPSSPHWSASIGTGQAAEDSSRRDGDSVAALRASATSSHADAHWTSKIGTGRAADSRTAVTASKGVASRVAL